MSKNFEIILAKDKLNKLVELLPKKGIVLLQGDLASGKTTLVKEILKFHKIDDIATSPTFSIMQKYNWIYHYDIYNNGTKNLLNSGLFENLFEDGLHLVEWGDEELESFLKKFNLDYTVVKISEFNNKRKYEVICA